MDDLRPDEELLFVRPVELDRRVEGVRKVDGEELDLRVGLRLTPERVGVRGVVLSPPEPDDDDLTRRVVGRLPTSEAPVVVGVAGVSLRTPEPLGSPNGTAGGAWPSSL